MILYISGPITGIVDDNRYAFKTAAARLRNVGYEVINPHDIGAQSGYRNGLRWSDYLRLDLAAILTEGVTGIATLPGWYKSPGAIFECDVARKLDLPVGPEEFWLAIAKGINQ